MTTRIEYRVRPVTRYIVTRFLEGEDGSAECRERGEYGNANEAYSVAYALCKQEHEMTGWPIGDERIRYPEHPDHQNAQPA